MIEEITRVYAASDGQAHLDSLVNSVMGTSPAPHSAIEQYVARERDLHGEFAAFISGRCHIVSRQLRFTAGGEDARRWQVDAYEPVSLETDVHKPLQAFPFIESDVVTHEWRAVPYEYGVTNRSFPVAARLAPRAIGFYVTSLSIANVLNSSRVSQPWLTTLHTAQLGVARRDAPQVVERTIPQVTPQLKETQMKFGVLLREIAQIEPKTKAQAV